jgi:L-fuconolactonase
MKIDSHQHYWNFNTVDYAWMGEDMSAIQRNFSPIDFLPHLQSIDFDGSIAVQARQSIEETRWLLQLADAYPHIKGVVGWVDLCSEVAEEQIKEFSKHPKAVGVRHVIHDEEEIDFMLRPDFIRGVKLLEKYQLTYDILIFEKHLSTTNKFVSEISDSQVFVVDHIAKPFIKNRVLQPWKDEISILAKNLNVYCKVSGLVTEADWNYWSPDDIRPYLDVVFESFGAERIMIGSDWPVCLVTGEYQEVMHVVIDYISELSVSEKDMILGGNAVKAYKL